MKTIEQWDYFEVTLQGYTDGNPYTDYTITGSFQGGKENLFIKGFYNGNGIYKIRFMPSYTGMYSYVISGSFSSEETKGEFMVNPAATHNHGVVRVKNNYHFSYEDGTPFYPVGTTCYAWVHQNEQIKNQTINTLSNQYFNKIRFCIFPKYYDFNRADPILFPYSIKEDPKDCYNWDFTLFQPLFFENIEKQLLHLLNLGIEADIILFHPYDKWGFSSMSREADALYLNYVIARLSSFRNIWWSLANEYDNLSAKGTEDWEYLGNLLQQEDPYRHLRSIHNCVPFYDHTKPWITHCSIQRQDIYKCAEYTDNYRTDYGKPIILDEIAYEGDFPYAWGNISGKELVRRFWEATVRGGYATHGETFFPELKAVSEKDMASNNFPEDGEIWWSHGGSLSGESGPRLKFLQDILKETPGNGLKHIEMFWDDNVACSESNDGYLLFYFGFCQPKYRHFAELKENGIYEVDIIDTWDMTIQNAGTFQGKFTIELPGKEYIAVRIQLIQLSTTN